MYLLSIILLIEAKNRIIFSLAGLQLKGHGMQIGTVKASPGILGSIRDYIIEKSSWKKEL
jgi:hypothetical protein